MNEKREITKNKTKEEKEQTKMKNEKINQEYSLSILDGTVEKIGNFWVEPRSIFKGRGMHPKSGYIKESVMPEDITLNLSKLA